MGARSYLVAPRPLRCPACGAVAAEVPVPGQRAVKWRCLSPACGNESLPMPRRRRERVRGRRRRPVPSVPSEARWYLDRDERGES